jgi:hypothetical protein
MARGRALSALASAFEPLALGWGQSEGYASSNVGNG